MKAPWIISLVVLLAVSLATNVIQAVPASPVSPPARPAPEVPGQEITFSVSGGLIGGSIEETSATAISQSDNENRQTIHFSAPHGVTSEEQLEADLHAIRGVRRGYYEMGKVTVKREPGFTFIPFPDPISIGQEVATVVDRYRIRK